MDNFDYKKYLAEGKLSLRKPATLKEGKGQDLADEYVAKLRVLFKNLNDDELDEFKKTIAKSLDLNESKGLKEGKELDVIETDNRDSKYTILRLSNGDYVEVNVIELYQNLIDNQESVNEGHSLEGKDLNLLKSLKDQIDQGVLDSKKKDAFVALLTGLIDTNATPTDLEEGMSDEGIVKSIEDIRDSLESGESDGMPLDNETEALLYQELERLRDMLLKRGLSALDTY